MPISLLVVTCDKYQAFWPLFYELLFRNASSVFQNIYHSSESKYPVQYPVKPILSQLLYHPSNWSEGVILALSQIDEPYIILMLEDFFFTEEVNERVLKQHISFMGNHENIKCLRLTSFLKQGNPIFHEYMERTSEHGYRISTQAAIWDKKYLLSLLRNGETAWEFEENASKRSVDLEGKVLVAKEDALRYINAVVRGKMTQKAAELCLKENISLDIDQVSINSHIEEFYWNTSLLWLRHLIDFLHYHLYPIKKLLPYTVKKPNIEHS